MLQTIESVNTVVNKFIWGILGFTSAYGNWISAFMVVYSLVAIIGATVDLGLI